jgi:hypothetical protein
MNHLSAEGIDLIWLAQDRQGFVGAFITAGSGPIPKSALAYALVDPSLEEEAINLPERSSAYMLVQVPDSSSFLALAKRGLAVFDWQDIHRTSVQETKAYEAVCRPESPIAAGALPPRLRAAAQATTISVESFANCAIVEVAHGA